MIMNYIGLQAFYFFQHHPDGTLANADDEVASLTSQALYYDALVNAGLYFAQEFPELAQMWFAMAAELKGLTLEMMWDSNQKFFGMGVDRNPETQNHQLINTPTSMPAEMLSTMLLEGKTPEEQYQIEHILKRIFSPDFLTIIGVRAMDVNMQEMLTYWFYQGPTSVWMVMNNFIIEGLHRLGFVKLATELENRMINFLNAMGTFAEFGIVTPEGVPCLDEDTPYHLPKINILSTNKNQKGQTWTVSAVEEIRRRRQRPAKARRPAAAWVQKLDGELMAGLVSTPLYITREQITEYVYKNFYQYHADIEGGKAAEDQYIQDHS